jgi:hypothetical protein
MPAAGYGVSTVSPVKHAEINGLAFPFRVYSFDQNGDAVFILYSRWEDRAVDQPFATEGVTRFNRLRSIWRGRGNHGQRVVSLALWGVRDAEAARETLLRQLRHVLVIEPPGRGAGFQPAGVTPSIGLGARATRQFEPRMNTDGHG